MNAKRILLALGAASAVALVGSVPAAYAGYPIKCVNNTAIVVDDADGSTESFTSIQDAVGAAAGSTDVSGDFATGSSGDTVIVCKGTYNENVTVPLADTHPVTGDPNMNDNITIRSYDDTNEAVVVGSGATPVFDITAPGVTLGGPGLGLTITGTAPIGVRVGVDAPIDDEDDDPDLGTDECPDPANVTECPDKELPAFDTTNVSIVGNRIKALNPTTAAVVTGIKVNNTNNTLVFRNLITGLVAGPDEIAYGVRFNQTNYNGDVLGNEVSKVTQTGGTCAGSTLSDPSAGVVGVAFEDEMLDALIYDTKIESLTATCTAAGVYSNAWGGLENDRNGQQVPIATDAVDNRIKKISGNASGGIVLAPITPDTQDDESFPSSFRVLANDIDNTGNAVAVLMPLAAYSYIRENDLDGDNVGVLNTTNGTVDATNNWWGCAEGPRISTNPYSTGKKECAEIVNTGATSVTTYNPWTKHHIDHAGAHAGEYAGHN